MSQLRQRLTNHVSAFCCVIIANACIVFPENSQESKSGAILQIGETLTAVPRC
jgi:hypothetical protein